MCAKLQEEGWGTGAGGRGAGGGVTAARGKSCNLRIKICFALELKKGSKLCSFFGKNLITRFFDQILAFLKRNITDSGSQDQSCKFEFQVSSNFVKFKGYRDNL